MFCNYLLDFQNACVLQVAKIYRENERVGFAQICPGFNLYVCPRSDTIMTILAESGFFEGMAAVEEDQDSLIGCVIWRRSHPSLSSEPKKLDKKKTSMQEHHFLSTDSSIAEVNFPPILGARSAAENATLVANESNTMQLSNNPSNSGSLKTKCGPGTTPTIPYNSPLIPAQPLHAQKPDSRSLRENMRCNEYLNNRLDPMPSAPVGPQQVFTEVPGVPTLPMSPSWPSKARYISPKTDVDDDLLEFDFNSACGVPETSAFRYLQPDHQTQDAPSFNNKQLPIQMAKNAGGTTPHELPSVKPRGSMQISPSSSFLVAPIQQICQGFQLGILGPYHASNNPPVAPVQQIAVPQPSLNAPSPASLCPPKGQAFCQGFQRGILGPYPASNNPPTAPVQQRPTTKFVPSRQKPPFIPNTAHSSRPNRKFGTKPPQSNAGWRSSRP